MKTPQRVAWLEGAELFPQHLQQQDAYHERLVDMRLSQLTPEAWGVGRLELDPGALAAGQVRVSVFEGVMPDGTPVVVDANEPEAPPARAIEPSFSPTQKALDVYLALPRERDGAPSYGETAGSARHTIVTRTIRDAGGSAPDHPVTFGQRNLTLLFGNEAGTGDFEAIKIAEVVRDARGALAFNERYVAPALRLEAAPVIGAGLRRLLALLVAKHRDLARARRQGEGSSVEFGSGDITRFLQLSALGGAIPVVSHLAESPELSPRTAYLALADLAGRLTAFVIDGDPTTIPAYAFQDLGRTFGDLFTTINGLLHATVREQYVALPLEIRDGRYVVALDDPRFEAAREILLGVRSDLPEAQTAERFARLARVAAAGELSHLIRVNAAGVALRLTPKPPPEIPVRAGVVYFSVSPEDLHWQSALRDRSLAIALPPAFASGATNIELYAVPRAERGGR